MMRPHPLLCLFILSATALSAGAAVVFYDGRQGASTSIPAGMSFQEGFPSQRSVNFSGHSFGIGSYFNSSNFELTYFTQGSGLIPNGGAAMGEYMIGGLFVQGAVETSGSFSTGYSGINFALLDVDNDGDNETVGAFYFSATEAFLIATSDIPDTPWSENHSIPAGYSEMSAASGGSTALQGVPEPTTPLFVAVSTVVSLTRRRRKLGMKGDRMSRR